jgi:hypothetical protein
MTDTTHTTPEGRSFERPVGRIATGEIRQGVTLEQAHDVFRRFNELLQAAPTVAAETGIEYETVCGILGGRIWPQARQQWVSLQP